MNLCEENVKLIVLTVYKRFLEAHKFCLCHNLLNSQWRSFIENVGLVSNFVRSDSSLLYFKDNRTTELLAAEYRTCTKPTVGLEIGHNTSKNGA